jgi:hypothetical protein
LTNIESFNCNTETADECSFIFSTLSPTVPFTEYPIWADAPSAKNKKKIPNKMVRLMVGVSVVILSFGNLER